MDVDRGLERAVASFRDELAPMMEAVALYVDDVDPETLRRNLLLEAYNLAAAFIDADGLETDDELWAFIATFAPHYGGELVKAQPADLRRAATLRGKRGFLDEPSDLFEILLNLDRRQRTKRAWAYYERAMYIAHTVASIDSHVSTTELQAIEDFRELLLDRIRTASAEARGGDGGGAARVSRPASDHEAPEIPAHAQASEEDGEQADDRELPPARPLEELLSELDRLVGLEGVKQEVKLVANLIQVQNLRRERGLAVGEQSRHLVFVGNPGTGKTTVARLLAEIYRTLGVVDRGHLVETDRSGLVAGFVGQTAQKVVAVFDDADEGVLLIDEAYALSRGTERDFGIEAIDAIVKLIEDRRDSVVVIACGYPDEMADFLDSNPGLRSRFPKTIHFADYTTDELCRIFELIGENNAYLCDDEATSKVRAWFDAQPRGHGFGNGRLARNLFEAAVANQATRVVEIDDPTDQELVTLTAGDIPSLPRSDAETDRGAR